MNYVQLYLFSIRTVLKQKPFEKNNIYDYGKRKASKIRTLITHFPFFTYFDVHTHDIFLTMKNEWTARRTEENYSLLIFFQYRHSLLVLRCVFHIFLFRLFEFKEKLQVLLFFIMTQIYDVVDVMFSPKSFSTSKNNLEQNRKSM